MGSPLRALLVAPPGSAAGSWAESAWITVRNEMEEADRALSRFRVDSDLTRLNLTAGSGAWTTASWRLYAMAAGAARAWRLTDGRFDARILSRLEQLGELAGTALPDGSGPSADEPGIERDPRERRLRITAPIDSGGIGKGLGLRWARRAAGRRLPDGGGLFVEAGGDVAVAGRPPDGASWKIGIEDPGGGSEPIAVIGLTNGAVATSSIAVRRWIAPDGRPVHHLIDPATGEPGGDGLVAVSVAHPDPAWAEVWSKALFLAGPQRIGPLARSHGLAAWWIGADGGVEMTPAGRACIVWERIRPAQAERTS